MTSILDGELAADVAEALLAAGLAIDITITRSEVVSPAPHPWEPPVTAPVDYPAKGWPDAWTEAELSGTRVQSNDVKVCVIATSLSITPVVGDHVTVRGQTGEVVRVDADPALAVYTLQVRA
jgi:hypothetical protein